MTTTQPGPDMPTPTYAEIIAEKAAAAVVSRLQLIREPGETHIEALCWALGETDMLTYEKSIMLVVKAALMAHAGHTDTSSPGSLVAVDGAPVPDSEYQDYWDAVLTQGPSDH